MNVAFENQNGGEGGKLRQEWMGPVVSMLQIKINRVVSLMSITCKNEYSIT